MRKHNLPFESLLSQDSISKGASQIRHGDVSSFYVAVGEGQVSAQSVTEKVLASSPTQADGEDAEIARDAEPTYQINGEGRNSACS